MFEYKVIPMFLDTEVNNWKDETGKYLEKVLEVMGKDNWEHYSTIYTRPTTIHLLLKKKVS